MFLKKYYYLLLYYLKFIYSVIEIYFRKEATKSIDHLAVSITSFEKRINYRLILVLKSLLKQSVNVETILLSLSKEDIKILPNYFLNFLGKNKRIKLLETSRDFRSYNKYIPILNNFPDYGFITVDDDIVYDYNFVSTLLNTYDNPLNNFVVIAKCHKMTYNNGRLNSYLNWEFSYDNYKEIEIKDIFLITGAGIYFPSKVLSIDYFDWEIIKEKFYTVDDVFINKLLDLKLILKVRIKKRLNLLEMYDPRISFLNLNTFNTLENSNDKSMKINLENLLQKRIND
jgi:hypothetical protein